MTRTVAIVQARMGSTRLPGKVLKDIEGRPMLGRILDRLSRAGTLDDTVVATSTVTQDDVLAAWCRSEGHRVHRGPEDDVLSRYVAAATMEKADTVVRVTGDCPLIDPGLVDEVVSALAQSGADYAANVVEPRTYPRGLDVEAFTRSALERADSMDTRPDSREHVTSVIRRHPEVFRVAAVRSEVDRSSHRWTVDTPEDLELAREVYRHFGHDRFSWLDAVEAFARHPAWTGINRHVQQKGAP